MYGLNARAFKRPVHWRRSIGIARVAEPDNRLISSLTSTLVNYTNQLVTVTSKLADLERSTKEEALEALTTRFRLKECQGELLELKGMLSMRGVFDYIYGRWDDDRSRASRLHRHPDMQGKGRKEQWAAYLKHRPNLLQCIEKQRLSLKKSKKRRPDDPAAAGLYVTELYHDLSDKIHDDRSPQELRAGSKKVRIVDDALDRQQCRALMCICEDFSFPAVIEFKL